MIKYTVTKKDLDIIHTALTAILERERNLHKIIENLEKQVTELKAKPKTVVHNHYHYTNPAPVFIPNTTVQPNYPYVWSSTESNYKT